MRSSFFIFIAVLLFSCGDDQETITPNLNYNYAGLEVGRFVVYDVTSIFYDDFTETVDTSLFQIKEVVASRFIDLEGDEAFVVNRFRKEVDSLGFVLTDVWTSKLTSTTYEKVEENERFLKLIFPIRINKTWNGNAKNNLGEVEYEFTAVHQSEIIGGNQLDSVSTVLQFENINLVEEEFFEEKFAANIGLVYKKSVDVDNVFDNGTGLWVRNAGIDITMTLSSFGIMP